ncbi:hypothetical protein [Delftia acidovorans]|uniref:hypothetical protein n=1 Tax=Delftia acidovorans TaxID=80866 RepID=UPI003D140509
MPSAIGQIGGALVGGLFSDSGGGQSQTQTREPWGPAQQGLKDVLSDATKLREYYKQNPFNQLQQTSLQNLYGDIDNYRQNMAPSMMALSNRLMNSNYQRAPAGSELGGFLQPERGMGSGMAPGMGGMGQAAGSGQGGALSGLLGQAGQGYSPLTNGGLLGGISGALGGSGGLMSGQGQDMTQGQGVAQGMQSSGLRPTAMIPTMRTNPGEAYGQIDFKALNPWTSGSIKEETPTQSNNDLTDLEREYLRTQFMNDKQRYDQYGSDAFSGAFIPNFGGSTSTVPMTPFIRKMIGN